MHERIRRTEEAIEFIPLATRTIIYSPQHSIQHHGAQWKAVEDEKLSQLLDRSIFFNAERDLEHRKEEPSQICLSSLSIPSYSTFRSFMIVSTRWAILNHMIEDSLG